MGFSKKWKRWYAVIDLKTCAKCRNNNGKIYDIYEEVEPAPPLHPFCRCLVYLLWSIPAGEATNEGLYGADWYIKHLGKLPNYYITEEEAKSLGWVAKKGNLNKVAPNRMLTKGVYSNDADKLPKKNERIWYEADINYNGGWRNNERILFSNDGLIFVTYDHYKTFIEIE